MANSRDVEPRRKAAQELDELKRSTPKIGLDLDPVSREFVDVSVKEVKVKVN